MSWSILSSAHRALAVGVCVLAGTAAAGPAEVPAPVPAATARPVVVDPASLPLGATYAGAWADLRKGVVHRPGPDLAVRLSKYAWIDRVERVAGGYLFGTAAYGDISGELMFYGDDGSTRRLAPGLTFWDDDAAGTHVAYTRWDEKRFRYFHEVAEVATGRILVSRRVDDFGSVRAFDGETAWVAEVWERKWLARWNVATGKYTRLRRLAFAQGVDTDAVVAFGSRKTRSSRYTVAPLDVAAGWGPWTTSPIGTAAVSPDRQLIATVGPGGGSMVVRILRLTTGRVVQTYRSRYDDGFEYWLVWEDDQHVLASGSARNGGFTQAVLRLSTTGTAERISPFRRYDRRIMPIPHT